METICSKVHTDKTNLTIYGNKKKWSWRDRTNNIEISSKTLLHNTHEYEIRKSFNKTDCIKTTEICSLNPNSTIIDVYVILKPTLMFLDI